MTISILLIDDHTLFRSGIKALLSRQDDFAVVGEAADGLSGVKLVEQLGPDVVLLDLDMPVMNGREALEQILHTRPAQTVIMLTVSEDGDDLTECMRLGARGYLLKNIDADFLLNAIRRAVDGDSVLSPEMTTRLVSSLVRGGKDTSDDALSSLTPREMEILGYLAAGYSNKMIALRLDVAESTVKAHVQNILRKLDLDSRVQAAVYAVRHNVPKPAETA